MDAVVSYALAAQLVLCFIATGPNGVFLRNNGNISCIFPDSARLSITSPAIFDHTVDFLLSLLGRHCLSPLSRLCVKGGRGYSGLQSAYDSNPLSHAQPRIENHIIERANNPQVGKAWVIWDIKSSFIPL